MTKPKAKAKQTSPPGRTVTFTIPDEIYQRCKANALADARAAGTYSDSPKFREAIEAEAVSRALKEMGVAR